MAVTLSTDGRAAEQTAPREATGGHPAPAWPHCIGILGGLGPHAHVEFERNLLRATERRLGRAPRDQDFPPWSVVCQPQTPDRTAALLQHGPSPVAGLVGGLRRLERVADFAVIACNTAHAFVAEIRRSSSIPILDVVTETLRYVVDRFGEGAKVGLLATSGTIASNVYGAAAGLVSESLRVLSLLDLPIAPEMARELQERSIMGAIYGRQSGIDDLCGGVKGGAHLDPAICAQITRELTEVVGLFREAGAPAVILGCTELPLVLPPGPFCGVELIDPLAVAADVALDIASGARPLPR
jgi:aspartate racemase